MRMNGSSEVTVETRCLCAIVVYAGWIEEAGCRTAKVPLTYGKLFRVKPAAVESKLVITERSGHRIYE